MQLNDVGRMIEQWCFELNRKFPTIETDEFVVMPNLFHGIVVSPVGADLRVGPVPDGAHAGAPLRESAIIPASEPNRTVGTGAPMCAPASLVHEIVIPPLASLGTRPRSRV